MLKPFAFAHSLAILSGVIYLGLYVLALIWYDAFRFLFNNRLARQAAAGSDP